MPYSPPKRISQNDAVVHFHRWGSHVGSHDGLSDVRERNPLKTFFLQVLFFHRDDFVFCVEPDGRMSAKQSTLLIAGWIVHSRHAGFVAHES